MSPTKITDADKLEIVALYREGGETTASLAHRFGVSNSTVSRLLKTTIPEDEYDRLIQRKRGAKVGSDRSTIDHDDLAQPSVILGTDLQVVTEQTNADTSPDIDIVTLPSRPTMTEDPSANTRRVRRRSSAADEIIDDSILAETSTEILVEPEEEQWIAAELPQLVFDEITPVVQTSRTPVLRHPLPTEFDDFDAANELSFTTDDLTGEAEPVEEMLEADIEADAEAVNALAEMFGEEIAGDEDEEFEDEEEFSEQEAATPYQKLDANRLLTGDRLHIRVTPLSEATLPRTCYIVIDKFAELIVRPLKDFADLGQIPGEEIQQRTLPIFDNHRVAKRFSNQRTQRVIKVPDSKVFHKTSHHLRMKGITRLLVDGSIYSLN